MRKELFKAERGFSLVELLMVLLILGIVMSAVYSLYLTHQRTAYTQEEVVEVQQNLRIAMDSIARDIRMAGMMVPLSGLQTTPLRASYSNYSTSTCLNAGSAEGVYARIAASPTITGGTNSVTCRVEGAEAVDRFAASDTVRLYRPIDVSQPLGATLTVAGVFRNTTSISLQRATNFAGTEIINNGDIIAKVSTDGSASDPNTIEYYLVAGGTSVNSVVCPQNQKCLVRQVNGNSGTKDIIASNLSDLRFSYIMDDYKELKDPAAPPYSLSQVRGIKVDLKGRTATTSVLSGGAKERELVSVIKLRNRR